MSDFNCPLCDHESVSVAAMNLAETKHWSKRGTFSGSGVGIGTGGLGVGVGGGSYSETGVEQTKRADVFDEPEKASLPFGAVIAVAMFVIIAFSMAPGMIKTLAESSPAHAESTASVNPQIKNIADSGEKLLTMVAPLFAFAVIGFALITARGNKEREARYNSEVYPKTLERYNEIRYCEHCNTLFDGDGNTADGNKLGFEKIMSLRGVVVEGETHTT